MPPIRLRAVPVVCLILVSAAASACHPHRGGVKVLNLHEKICPNYQITAQDIQVQPGGGTFLLSPSNSSQLVFDSGAVSVPSTYHIQGVQFHNNDVAGFSITPVAGADTTFANIVHLRIGYDGCPWQNAAGRFYVARVENDTLRAVGDGRSTIKKYVEAAIDHFSDYIIAD